MTAVPIMQQARIAIREGRLVDARRLLRQAVHEDPFNHAAWLLLARATPDKQLATQYIDRARHIQPHSPLVQQAEEDLLSANKVNKQRRMFSWHLAPVLAGIVLLLGLLGMSFGEGSWEQVIALQNEGAHQISAASLQSSQNEPKQVQQTNSDAISDPESVKAAESPAILPTADAASKNESENEAVIESAENPDQTGVASGSEEALPAAILNGIETEASSKDQGIVAASDAASREGITDEDVSTAATEAEEAAEVTAADETEEIEAEEQDAAEIESEAIVEEEVVDFDPASAASGERWIDVNLTTQSLVAYEGDTPVLSSVISSGMWQFPTVTGQFRTWMKYETQDMTGYHLGYNYALEDVPHVMYFFEDYAIHGAYWHNNFGTPMSHGCVNVNTYDAAWLYDWAPVGTIVNVHH